MAETIGLAGLLALATFSSKPDLAAGPESEDMDARGAVHTEYFSGHGFFHPALLHLINKPPPTGVDSLKNQIDVLRR